MHIHKPNPRKWGTRFCDFRVSWGPLVYVVLFLIFEKTTSNFKLELNLAKPECDAAFCLPGLKELKQIATFS